MFRCIFHRTTYSKTSDIGLFNRLHIVIPTLSLSVQVFFPSLQIPPSYILTFNYRMISGPSSSRSVRSPTITRSLGSGSATGGRIVLTSPQGFSRIRCFGRVCLSIPSSAPNACRHPRLFMERSNSLASDHYGSWFVRQRFRNRVHTRPDPLSSKIPTGTHIPLF